jgi:hypothetical protein
MVKAENRDPVIHVTPQGFQHQSIAPKGHNDIRIAFFDRAIKMTHAQHSFARFGASAGNKSNAFKASA